MLRQLTIFGFNLVHTSYDTNGIFSSPRALFMFRSFGHEKSSVLDGGLPRWYDEGYPIESLPPSVPKLGSYSTPELEKDAVRSNYCPLSVTLPFNILNRL